MIPEGSAVDTVLELKNISKEFPGVKVLREVNFDLKKGEVHAIVGENGAGKSTLIKILAGVYPPNEGEIQRNGKLVKIKNPREGIDSGISVIYQEFNLIPYLSVAKNIFLGREHRRKLFPFLIDYPSLYRDTRQILESIGSNINPRTEVIDLGVAQKQLVEMAKALSVNASILVMDEPTATLTEREIKELFCVINDVKKKGVSVIYISHRLEEIFEIADRITVLRNGKVIKTMRTSEVQSVDEIIELMVGRSMSAYFPREFNHEKGEVALEVKNLTQEKVFNDVSFSVRFGEIVGLSGLVGAGRTEVARAIFGADSHKSGEIRLFGKRVKPTPQKSVELGIGFVPEDRKHDGLGLILSIRDNVTIANLSRLFPSGFINSTRESALVSKYIEALKIKTPSMMRIVKYLSGGNQQKVVVAKWLCTQAKIFIFDEPTRGVDVGAKAEIHQLMDELVRQGAAVLMISSELPEVLHMSDRIYVMKAGQIVKELQREEADQETVLKYSIGGRRNE
jgi:ribose transport system ATP-binding protein